MPFLLRGGIFFALYLKKNNDENINYILTSLNSCVFRFL